MSPPRPSTRKPTSGTFIGRRGCSTGRSPHCRWELIIDEDNEPLDEADITKITRMTTAATFEFPPMRDGTPHVPSPADSA